MRAWDAIVKVAEKTVPSGYYGRGQRNTTETTYHLNMLPAGEYEFHYTKRNHFYPERIWINTTVKLLPGFSYWPHPNMRQQRAEVDKLCKKYGFRRAAKVHQFDNWNFRYDLERIEI